MNDLVETTTILDDQCLSNTENSETMCKENSNIVACMRRERKERKGGSYVWNYCQKLSRHLIRCNLCNKMMSFHGTANVITHLQRKHNIVGKIDGDRVTLENTIPDLSIDEEEMKCKFEGDGTTRPYRRSSSTASIVWKYCTRVGRDVVRCGFCKKNLSYQGTSNLQRHLHRMHGVVTQMRHNHKDCDPDDAEQWKHYNSSFIWQHITLLDNCDDKAKCNLCDDIFDPKDMEEMSKHLLNSHGVEPKGSPVRRRKRRRYASDDDSTSLDDADYDNDWNKEDTTYFDEINASKDQSFFDQIIEEDPDHLDDEETPFDPSMLNELPLANPLSAHSSRAASPLLNGGTVFKSFKLQKLNEEKVRMETEYFREKAGFYRMQKYLTALQAKKMRKELEQLNGSVDAVVKSDNNYTNTNLEIIG